MKKSILHWFNICLKVLCLILFLQIILACAVSRDEDKVIECFDNYKTAILNDMGEEAVTFIDSKTVDYYGELLEKVLYADRDVVMQESFINRLMIFRIRHSVQVDKLVKMDGIKLLEYSINNGWVGKDAVAGSVIKNVKIEGDSATVELYKNDKRTGMSYKFYRENTQWKINLTSLFLITHYVLKQQAKNTGYDDEDAFIFDLIEGISGKRVSKDIYEPLIKK